MPMISIAQSLQDHLDMIHTLHAMVPTLTDTATRLSAVIRAGGKILLCGNGGSAADCQHLAAELVGRFRQERRALPALALTTDTSILTAVANDYAYNEIFSRQVEALCQPEDAVIGISTSGNSENVVRAILTARQRGALTVGFSGRDGGRLARVAEICLTIPVEQTARIQEGHLLLGHILCDWIEQANMPSIDFFVQRSS